MVTNQVVDDEPAVNISESSQIPEVNVENVANINRNDTIENIVNDGEVDVSATTTNISHDNIPLDVGGDDEENETTNTELEESDHSALDEVVNKILSDIELSEATSKEVRERVAKVLGVNKVSKMQKRRIKKVLESFMKKKLAEMTATTNENNINSESENEKKEKKSLQTSSNDAPSRPHSAFIFFSTARRAEVKEANPALTFGELGRQLGHMWSVLSDDDRQPFIAQANAAKQSYAEKMAIWKLENPDGTPKKKKAKLASRKRKTSGVSSVTEIDVNVDADQQEENLPKSVIDQVLSTMKPKRKKKEDISDYESDFIVPNLVGRMEQAVAVDSENHSNQRPATTKMAMLDEVIRQAKKQRLQETLLDRGLLTVLKDWLRILPDGSLPNLTLRSCLYDLFFLLPIDKDYLMESQGLGKVLMALWKHPQETAKNKTTLRRLIEKWSRPLFNADTDYTKLEEHDMRRRNRIQKRAAIIRNAPDAKIVHYQSRHAKIPNKATFDYAVRPESGIVAREPEDEETQRSKLLEQERQQRIRRRFELMSRKGKTKRQAVSVNITKG